MYINTIKTNVASCEDHHSCSKQIYVTTPIYYTQLISAPMQAPSLQLCNYLADNVSTYGLDHDLPFEENILYVGKTPTH